MLFTALQKQRSVDNNGKYIIVQLLLLYKLWDAI